MRTFIYTLVLIAANSVIINAQQLFFNGSPVMKIQIVSNSGHYHLDKYGSKSGKQEQFLISFDSFSMSYKVKEYESDSYKSTVFPKRSFNNPKKIIGYNGMKIKNSYIEGLLSSVKNEYEKPDFDSLGISRKQFKGIFSPKNMMAVAEKNSLFPVLENLSAKEKKDIIADYCNTDSFSLFLIANFDTSSINNESTAQFEDRWDNLIILIKTKKKSYIYGAGVSDLRQPFYNYTNTKENFFPIHNLSINKYLLRILPYDFQGRKNLEVND